MTDEQSNQAEYTPRSRERLIEILRAQDENPRSWQREAARMLASTSPAALDPVTVEACAKVADTIDENDESYTAAGNALRKQCARKVAARIRALIGQPAPTGTPEVTTNARADTSKDQAHTFNCACDRCQGRPLSRSRPHNQIMPSQTSQTCKLEPFNGWVLCVDGCRQAGKCLRISTRDSRESYPTGNSEQIVERPHSAQDNNEPVPVWRGEASLPSELADEIAATPTKIVQLPYVEPISVVELTISLANRDMIIAALRAAPTGNAPEPVNPTEAMVLAGADVLLDACSSEKGMLRPWKPFDMAQVALKVFRAMVEASPVASTDEVKS